MQRRGVLRKKTAFAVFALVFTLTAALSGCGGRGTAGSSDNGAAESASKGIAGGTESVFDNRLFGKKGSKKDKGEGGEADEASTAIQGEENAGKAASGGRDSAPGASGSSTGSTGAAETAAGPSNGSTGAAETAAGSSTGSTGAAETAVESRGLIVIDPGHQQNANLEQEPIGPGASETKYKVSGGTSGVSSGVPEYQLTLDIGLLLREELEKRGYRVILVRETNDVDISNSDRARIANEAGADAFVRLHANGGGGSAAGAMTICQTPGNVYNGALYEKSRALSDCILDAYTQKTGIGYEYVWETDTMSGINWAEVPVTILEMGYMTNSEEDRKMQDPQMQQTMAEGIADGIDAYMDRYPTEAGGTGAATAAAALSPEMEELEKQLGTELKEKEGDWSLYLYRFDTGEEIGINAGEAMISASLIKLYIAGSYLEKVEKEEVADEYQNQLFLMLSQSDNDSANRLIDLLGKETVNDFIKEHHFSAGQLNRRMLEQDGTENYTSAEDCGELLRAVYEGTCVSKEASDRILEALRAQIDRNRAKIPAGVPTEVETANKTGELFTKNGEGINVNVQNDAALIFAEDHPYVLVVMSAVPGAGEAELQTEIAELSREVYGAVCGETDSEE